MIPCAHQGKAAGCCSSLFRCNSAEVSAPSCTPSMEGFAKVIESNPGLDASQIGLTIHVCSECVTYLPKAGG